MLFSTGVKIFSSKLYLVLELIALNNKVRSLFLSGANFTDIYYLSFSIVSSGSFRDNYLSSA